VPQQNLGGQKHPKFGSIFANYRILSQNNSKIDRYNENLKSKWSTTTPPTLGVKNLVNFGPQTKKLMLTHPTVLFWETVSALTGVLSRQIFMIGALQPLNWPALLIKQLESGERDFKRVWLQVEDTLNTRC